LVWIERYRGYRQIVGTGTLKALYLAVTYKWRERRKSVHCVPDFPKFSLRKDDNGKYYGAIVIDDIRHDYGPFDDSWEAFRHMEKLAMEEWRKNPYVLVKKGKKVIGRKHWTEWY
jgi:hypothetical protein